MTLYHCLDQGSYLSAVDWFIKTALDRILHTNGQHINKSRIFRELDIIEEKKEDIEGFQYKTLKKRDKDGMHIVFYDLTDSYFEGRKCELASAGRTKSNGFRKKRVVLSLLVTMKSTGDEFLKLMSLQSRQKAILELFQSENIVRMGYLKSMGIK